VKYTLIRNQKIGIPWSVSSKYTYLFFPCEIIMVW